LRGTFELFRQALNVAAKLARKSHETAGCGTTAGLYEGGLQNQQSNRSSAAAGGIGWLETECPEVHACTLKKPVPEPEGNGAGVGAPVLGTALDGLPKTPHS
jgi:hypothetical protein